MAFRSESLSSIGSDELLAYVLTDDWVEAAVDAALECEAASLEPHSCCSDGSSGCVSFGGAAAPLKQCVVESVASPNETDTIEAATLQRIIGGVRQGQYGSPSPFWVRLMAGSAQTGFEKPVKSSKRVRFAEGSSPSTDKAGAGRGSVQLAPSDVLRSRRASDLDWY